MLTCRIHAKEDLRIENAAEPPIGAGQVLIRLGAGGICGSDLHYYFEGRNGSFVVREPLMRYRLRARSMHRNLDVFEHDMLHGFSSMFADPAAAEVHHLKRRAYGNTVDVVRA